MQAGFSVAYPRDDVDQADELVYGLSLGCATPDPGSYGWKARLDRGGERVRMA